MTIRCLTRQPIVDETQSLVGYELSYEFLPDNVETSLANYSDTPEQSHALFDAFSHIHDECVSGAFPAFVRLSYDMLIADSLYELLPRNAVVEIMSDLPYDEAVHMALVRLKDAGFSIALAPTAQATQALLSFADIVKLDISQMDPHTLASNVHVLQARGVTLLAENIQNESDFRQCLALSFGYFQGQFLGQTERLSPF